MNHWRIDWDTLSGSGRWINPLMGWASSCVVGLSFCLCERTPPEGEPVVRANDGRVLIVLFGCPRVCVCVCVCG